MKSSRRVVITGMGVISPMGNTTEALWQSLLAGRSAVGPIQSFPVDHLPTKFAAEARDFTGSIDDFGPLEAEKKKAIRKGLKLMCRESQMGVAAAQRALTDAGLGEMGKCDPERTGVVFGSDYMITLPEDFTAGILRCIKDGEFDFSQWATNGMPQVTPLWLLKYLPNMPASHVAIYNDFRGPNNSITLREASANAAVGEAFRTIARGSADCMLAGATGTRVHPMKMVHTVLQEEVASETDPERASRPFDLNRMGMVLGEGAAAIIMEELSCAVARGATIYGEIIGTACGTVSARNGVAHRETALTNVMRRALDDAECTPREIGHVHAHGLSTRSCDEDEAKAVRLVFGDHARKVPVTAAKSYFGNLGAASGLVEMVSSVLAVKHQRLFKVLNHETTDPRCPLSVIRSEDDPGASFLTINVTPQGQASALVVRAVA